MSGLGGRANRQYAVELAQRGYVTLAPDYPTFGDYKVDFDPADGWQSGTMRAVWDNIRSVDLLQSLPEVDAANIGAIGHSLGGHNAMFTAVFEPRIKAVVSSCGFTRFHKYYEGKLAGADASWKADIKNPMPLTLEFAGTVNGDAMSGTVNAAVGSWPFSGTRSA